MSRHVSDNLIPSLADVVLDYLSMFDLIELQFIDLGFPTPQFFAGIVKRDLGEEVLQFSRGELDGFPKPSGDNATEGLVALLILGKLPLSWVSMDLFNYINAQSRLIRILVYPYLIMLLAQSDTYDVYDIENIILDSIVEAESTRPSNDFILDALVQYYPNPSSVTSLLEADELIANGNIAFVVHHRNDMVITPQIVTIAIQKSNYHTVQLLLERLFDLDNLRRLELQYVRDADITNMYRLLYVRLPKLYKRAYQHERKLAAAVALSEEIHRNRE